MRTISDYGGKTGGQRSWRSLAGTSASDVGPWRFYVTLISNSVWACQSTLQERNIGAVFPPSRNSVEKEEIG